MPLEYDVARRAWFYIDEPGLVNRYVAYEEPMVKKITVGCDPEFFLKNRKTKQNISAHGIVPGTKKEPHKLSKGAIQLDGTAVEFNIEPASTAKEFASNIDTVLKEVRKIVPERYSFNLTPAVFYGPKYFEKRIPTDSKLLGCDPDFDAYKWGKPNTPPDNASEMRTGAGHIHIGFDRTEDDEDHLMDCCILAKQFDAVFSLVERNWDKDEDRRKMYGKLGCFRPKPYGMEYRSLSNAWLKYPKLWPWLFEMTTAIYQSTLNGSDLSDYAKHFEGETLSPKVFNRTFVYNYLGSKCSMPVDFASEVYAA